jgi:hypothetical protein
MKLWIAINWISVSLFFALFLFSASGGLAVSHAQVSDATIKKYDPVSLATSKRLMRIGQKSLLEIDHLMFQ